MNYFLINNICTQISYKVKQIHLSFKNFKHTKLILKLTTLIKCKGLKGNFPKINYMHTLEMFVSDS